MPAPRRRRRPAPVMPSGGVEEVRIDSIAAGGEGVGRLADGRAVFVHRTAPGDLASVRLTNERPRWARGRLVEVLESSPVRRTPPCPHYGECGGCTVEHLEYAAQLSAKSDIAGNALRRIGGLAINAPEVIPSPREFRYRNRVSFALRRFADGEVIAGFHALHDPDRIVPVDSTCLLPEAAIAEVWERLRQVWGPGAELLPSGRNLRLTLRSTARGAVSLVIEGGARDGRLDELAERTEGLYAIWHRPADEVDARHAAGAPGLLEEWGEETFTVSGSAFLQVNREAAELLETYVVEQSGVRPGLRVVDAYCGIGLHAGRLAAKGAHVVGIELDPEAVKIADTLAADQAAGAHERASQTPHTLEVSRFVCGKVEELITEHLPADLVILNPPRSGLADGVVGQLLKEPPSRIIYVSCDPATLARDLKGLSVAFDVGSVRCFDLFPQTAHVETVVILAHRA